MLKNLSNYRIGENGAIQRVQNNRFLTWEITSLGYARVNLVDDDGNKKHYYVHRLVAKAFLNNPNNYKEVNHKDENKLNNHFSNLEWCTRQYNNTYGSRVKRTEVTSKRGTNNNRPVVLCDINTHEPIGYYISAEEAARSLNISGSTIRKFCKESNSKDNCCEFWFRYATQKEITEKQIGFIVI